MKISSSVILLVLAVNSATAKFNFRHPNPSRHVKEQVKEHVKEHAKKPLPWNGEPTPKAVPIHDDTDYMLQILDDLSKHFDGVDQFNRTYYDKMVQCFEEDKDKILWKGQVSAWQNIIGYWNTNGTTHDYQGHTDYWGGCLDGKDPRCANTQYLEYDEGLQEAIGRHKMMIYEPCNHVSNIAYFHASTKICDYPNWSISEQSINDQKRAMAALATGSMMHHGSHTYVGYVYDNQMISVIAYQAYQSAIEFIANGNTELTYLQETPRNQTSTQITDEIIRSFMEPNSVTNWAKVLNEADFPHEYFITFSALASLLFYLIMPAIFARLTVTTLATLILPEDEKAFILDTYLPLIKNATAQVKIPFEQQQSLVYKFLGTAVKLIYAFLFQEKYLKVPGFQTPAMIAAGGHGVMVVTAFADWLTGFTQTDQAVIDSVNVYPGQDKCKYQQAHSIWHEVSGNGLLDLVYVCDYMFYLTKAHNANVSEEEKALLTNNWIQ